MKCPRCESSLRLTRIKSIRVHRCAQCGGRWCGASELRLLKDREDHGDYRWIDFDLWKDRDRFLAGDQEKLPCPADGETMTSVRYGESPVRADICARCKGIWLDSGEYEKILQYLETVVDTETVSDYLSDVKDEFVEILTGKESVASGLADLGKVLYLLQLRFMVQHGNIAALVRRMARGIPGV